MKHSHVGRRPFRIACGRHFGDFFLGSTSSPQHFHTKQLQNCLDFQPHWVANSPVEEDQIGSDLLLLGRFGASPQLCGGAGLHHRPIPTESQSGAGENRLSGAAHGGLRHLDVRRVGGASGQRRLFVLLDFEAGKKGS